MHLASTFLSEHGAHRIERKFNTMNVITRGRILMYMGGHSWEVQRNIGCAFIKLERWQSKTVGGQVVELYLGEREVYIPLIVGKKCRVFASVGEPNGFTILPGHCLEGGWPLFSASQSSGSPILSTLGTRTACVGQKQFVECIL